jgi:hypothetical protein
MRNEVVNTLLFNQAHLYEAEQPGRVRSPCRKPRPIFGPFVVIRPTPSLLSTFLWPLKLKKLIVNNVASPPAHTFFSLYNTQKSPKSDLAGKPRERQKTNEMRDYA